MLYTHIYIYLSLSYFLSLHSLHSLSTLSLFYSLYSLSLSTTSIPSLSLSLSLHHRSLSLPSQGTKTLSSTLAGRAAAEGVWCAKLRCWARVVCLKLWKARAISSETPTLAAAFCEACWAFPTPHPLKTYHSNWNVYKTEFEVGNRKNYLHLKDPLDFESVIPTEDMASKSLLSVDTQFVIKTLVSKFAKNHRSKNQRNLKR